MKKLLTLLLLGSAVFTACTETPNIITEESEHVPGKGMKASEMYVYSGKSELGSVTRASTINYKSEVGYSIPDNGRYLVYYYIRIDGDIPGEDVTNLPSNQYFPQKADGKTMIDDLNHGYVMANVNWKSGKFEKYLWCTDGSAVKNVILEEPTLEDLLEANKSTKYDLSGYLEHKDDLHIIWYTCKKQSQSDHVWHIDGILTSKDRTDISQTQYGEEQIKTYDGYGMEQSKGDDEIIRAGHVEVDVHQQEHKDWNEIKTSVHLRDTVTAEVFIPIDYAEQADDFDIRIGEDYAYITEVMNTQVKIGEETFDLDVTITHEEAGIRIIIKPNSEALKAARREHEDGITYEIHSYVTSGISNEKIWEKLQKTTVTLTPYTLLTGGISSAFFEGSVAF